LTNPIKHDIINRMRKVSLRIAYYAFISVVLILGACMKPVGVMDFLNDERVQVIIGGGIEDIEGVKGGIGYEHPADLKPILSNGLVKLDEGDVVTVSKSAIPPNITIRASSPAGISYSNIEWYCNGTPLTVGVIGNEVTITADEDPFYVLERYRLIFVGTVDDIPYSAGIYIRVDP
jgi:hypothetical protein